MTSWIFDPVKALDEVAEQDARARQAQLTKPLGSLGRLEETAISLAAMQGAAPDVGKPFICVFAGDHGIAATGVSAFPQEVTAQMVANFARGGAAISVLAKSISARFKIINLGTLYPTDFAAVQNENIGSGTANMLEGSAMTQQQCAQSLAVGRESLINGQLQGANLFIGGEMGIGNTTAATALASAISGLSVASLTGPGTGLDAAGVDKKIDIIKQVLAKHMSKETDTLQLLQRMGGFEIAALVGSYVSAAQQGVAVLVDGFICTAAAMVAVALNPSCRKWMIFAHSSAEPGHQLMLNYLNATPLLNLGMRLGEGSGAALCAPLLQHACNLHNHMATFAEAQVAGKIDE